VRLDKITLEGRDVRLEPLTGHHAADLHRWATEETFRFFNNWRTIEDSNHFRLLVEDLAARRDALHFAVVHRATGRAIGATALMDYRPDHQGIEIGSSWIGSNYRGGRVNADCKLLLLTHSFETLDCERVQLKCDARNARSQAAIAKLGAVREGTLRNHMICKDGHVRDTVMYSIIRQEWPRIKEHLLSRLS